MNKFFSIIIPVYNSDERLTKALQSIENQNLKDDIEVIIVDDQDGKLDFYKDLVKKFTFETKVIETPENMGPGGARNVGMDAATGTWITFLDHDDEFAMDCFSIVKESIEQSGCLFVLSSHCLTANDYDYPITGLYTIDEGIGTLHGQFYNREMLKKYDIRFNSQLRTQEDTYFLSLLECHMLLDVDNYDEEKTEVVIPNVTYFWYLWPDSTSHKDDAGRESQFCYLESHFNDYINACYHSVLIATMKYSPVNKEFLLVRFVHILIYSYWFMEYFYILNYEKEPGNHSELITNNIKIISDFKHQIMEILDVRSDEELIGILRSFPQTFVETYSIIAKNNIMEDMIPFHDLQTFYTQIIV